MPTNETGHEAYSGPWMDRGTGVEGAFAPAFEGPTRLLLKPEEAADLLSVSRAKLYGLVRNGMLDSVKIGRSRRFTVEALGRCIAAHAVPRDRRRVKSTCHASDPTLDEVGRDA